MFAYESDGRIVGYYSLLKQNETECELNNLCVLEEYRHKKIGEQLWEHALTEAGKSGQIKAIHSLECVKKSL